MKKLLLLLLFGVFALNTVKAKISWEITGSTLTVSGKEDIPNYNPYDADISTAPWFMKRKEIQKVVIEDGITGIGDYAFYNLPALTSVTIPESVKKIGSMAFKYCSKLTSVSVPGAVKSIGDEAFLECTSLSKVTIADGELTTVGNDVFKKCEQLKSIKFPNTVKSVLSMDVTVWALLAYQQL